MLLYSESNSYTLSGNKTIWTKRLKIITGWQTVPCTLYVFFDPHCAIVQHTYGGVAQFLAEYAYNYEL